MSQRAFLSDQTRTLRCCIGIRRHIILVYKPVKKKMPTRNVRKDKDNYDRSMLTLQRLIGKSLFYN